MKWTEFHRGHEDCSRSFVRYFGEMVLKMETGGPCLEFSVCGGFLKAGSSAIERACVCRQAGERAASF